MDYDPTFTKREFKVILINIEQYVPLQLTIDYFPSIFKPFLGILQRYLDVWYINLDSFRLEFLTIKQSNLKLPYIQSHRF